MAYHKIYPIQSALNAQKLYLYPNPGSWANSTNGFTINSAAWAAPGSIGTTTANTANFTTLNAASLNVSGGATVSGNLTVTGNLTLAGTTTFINSTVITTNDLNLVLANSATNAITSNNAGIVVGTFANLIYNSAIPAWQSNVAFIPAANNLNLGNTSFVWNLYANNISGNGASVTSVNAVQLGGVSLGTVNTAITSNASAAYTNATSYAATIAATAFTNAVANAVANTSQAYANSTNGLGISGTANNSLYLGTVAAASYQLNSTLAANVATLTSNNATNLGGVAAANYVNTSGNYTISGNHAFTGTGTTINYGAGAYAVGYRDIPQNIQNTSYTTAASDSGGHIFNAANTGTLTYTIANNATVAWANGAAISIINGNTATLTIAGAGNVTIQLAGTTTTGSRTLVAGATATCIRVAVDRWFVGGAGVS